MPGARTAWSAIKQARENASGRMREAQDYAKRFGWDDQLRHSYSCWSMYEGALDMAMRKIRTLPLGKVR